MLIFFLFWNKLKINTRPKPAKKQISNFLNEKWKFFYCLFIKDIITYIFNQKKHNYEEQKPAHENNLKMKLQILLQIKLSDENFLFNFLFHWLLIAIKCKIIKQNSNSLCLKNACNLFDLLLFLNFNLHVKISIKFLTLVLLNNEK